MKFYGQQNDEQLENIHQVPNKLYSKTLIQKRAETCPHEEPYIQNRIWEINNKQTQITRKIELLDKQWHRLEGIKENLNAKLTQIQNYLKTGQDSDYF